MAEHPEYRLDVFKRQGNPSPDGKYVAWVGAKFQFVDSLEFGTTSQEETIAFLESFEAALEPCQQELKYASLSGSELCTGWSRRRSGGGPKARSLIGRLHLGAPVL
jgi:hypothetical protein